MKMWAALVATNAVWAGIAFAGNDFHHGSLLPTPDYAISTAVGILMAGESPTHHAKTIQVDEDGYVICSPEKKP